MELHSIGELNIHRKLAENNFIFNKVHEIVIKPGQIIRCHEFVRDTQSIVFVVDLSHLNEYVKIVLKPTYSQLIFYAPTFLNAFDLLLKHDIIEKE